MAQWQTLLQIARPTPAKAVGALGLVVVLAEFAQLQFLVEDLLSDALRIALRVIPSLVLAASHVVQVPLGVHVPLWEGLWRFAACCVPTLWRLAF